MSEARTRQRSHILYMGDAKTGQKPDSVTSRVDVFQGTQVTTDQLHGGPPPRGFRGDWGGNFLSVNHYYSDNGSFVKASAGGGPGSVTRFYEGRVYARYSDSAGTSRYPTASASSDKTLDALGTSGIAKIIPTNPKHSLVTSLGELRSEGVPRILGAQALRERSLSSVGGEYLNYSFGWKPLYDEYRSIAKTVKRSDEILRTYRRNSNKPVRRSFTFPTEIESVNTIAVTNGRPSPAMDTYLLGATGDQVVLAPVYKTQTLMRRRWLDCSFTYHVPVGKDLPSRMARFAMEADALYGTTPTPETVYNLTPWSWLFDWAGNMDDVVTNLSAFMFDGLVLNYGYMMEETSIEDTYTWMPRGGHYSSASGVGSSGSIPGQTPPVCIQTFGKVIKKRRKATPFGFGLKFDGFNAYQLSILAALGISKGGNQAKFGD